MKSKGVFVNFLGSRGSGKTTIANIACSKLEQNGYLCMRQHKGLVRKPFWRAFFNAITLWHFFDFEVFIKLGFTGRIRSLLPSLYRIYLPLAFMHDLNKLFNGKTDVLIYDSNILRGLISAVEYKKITEKSVYDFYKRKILSKTRNIVLIVVETKPVEAVRRWMERDEISLTDTEFANAVAERIDMQTSLNLVVDTLAQLQGVTLLRLDGDFKPGENAERIVDSINDCLFGHADKKE